MTPEEQDAPTDFPSHLLDPDNWVDPKTTFPGEIIVSRYVFSSDEYLEPTEFREERIPEPIPQWDIQVKRLDAYVLNPDGSQEDAVYPYGADDLRRVDLKKWSARDRKLVGLNSRYRKEFDIISSFKKAFGKVEPPESLVGKKGMFDWYITKNFSGSQFPSRFLLNAVSALPPDFVFTGEKVVIQRQEREESDESKEGTGEGKGTTTDSSLNGADLDSALAEFLNGKPNENLVGLIQQMPDEIRTSQVISEIANNTLVERLESAGLVNVTDGVINKV